MVMSVYICILFLYWILTTRFRKILDKLSKYFVFEKYLISKSNRNSFETLKDFNFNLKKTPIIHPMNSIKYTKGIPSRDIIN